MTTYSTIANTEIDQDSPVTQPLMTAMRDNPIAAFAEADASARSAGIYNAATWHPFGTYPLYDFTRDGGTTGPIETPDFEDGWEYRLIAVGLSTGTTTTYSLDLYRQTTAAYATLGTIATVTAANTIEAVYDFLLPRRTANHHGVMGYGLGGGDFANNTTARYALLGMSHATAQKILKARISLNTGTTDAGTVWLMRRADYLSA